jgi:hypothetical protein
MPPGIYLSALAVAISQIHRVPVIIIAHEISNIINRGQLGLAKKKTAPSDKIMNKSLVNMPHK